MRPAYKTSIIVFGFAALLTCALAGAPPARSQEAPAGAFKFDEFGRLHGCEAGARFDNFANILMETPGATGHIVAYDAQDGPAGFARGWMRIAHDYFVHIRGIDESRLVAAAAGRHTGKDLKLELWVVPPGAESPARPAVEKDEPPFAGMFASYGVWNDTRFYPYDEVSAGSYRTESVARTAFIATLGRQADSRGYVVAYTKKGSAAGSWRRFATRERALLEGALGGSRLTLVNGGRREEDEIELWIVPKDAPPPVKAAKREPALKEAALLGSYRRFFAEEDEGDETERKWLLGNLAEMLKADPQRVGCIVVFLEEDPGTSDPADGTTGGVIDYVKIAEGWLQELAARYGIEKHRVVLRVGVSDGWEPGSIETWVVPRGAPIPDPAGIIVARKAEADAEGKDIP